MATDIWLSVMRYLDAVDMAQSVGFPPKHEVEEVLFEVVRQTAAAGKWVSQGDVSLGSDRGALQYIQHLT